MTQVNPGNARPTDILVVDPDAAIGDGLQLLFETAGFVCRAVPNATSAEKFVREFEPRCLVIAAELSPMSGIELLTQFRRLGIEAPAIIVSSRGDVPTAVAAIRAGAIDFLEKPLIDARLLQAVRRVLHKGAAK